MHPDSCQHSTQPCGRSRRPCRRAFSQLFGHRCSLATPLRISHQAAEVWEVNPSRSSLPRAYPALHIFVQAVCQRTECVCTEPSPCATRLLVRTHSRMLWEIPGAARDGPYLNLTHLTHHLYLLKDVPRLPECFQAQRQQSSSSPLLPSLLRFALLCYF